MVNFSRLHSPNETVMPIRILHVFTRIRSAVDENNAAELARLPGAAVDFVARFVGDAARRPLLEAKCNAPQRLQLKVLLISVINSISHFNILSRLKLCEVFSSHLFGQCRWVPKWCCCAI